MTLVHRGRGWGDISTLGEGDGVTLVHRGGGWDGISTQLHMGMETTSESPHTQEWPCTKPSLLAPWTLHTHHDAEVLVLIVGLGVADVTLHNLSGLSGEAMGKLEQLV